MTYSSGDCGYKPLAGEEGYMLLEVPGKMAGAQAVLMFFSGKSF